MSNLTTTCDLQPGSYPDYQIDSDIYSSSRMMDHDEYIQKKDRFSKIQLHWCQIPRANNPRKPLQEKAIILLATVVHKLRKSGIVTLNHNYLSRITKCKRDQNVNLLKQLAEVLDISFHAKISINGRVCFNYYMFKHTQKGRAILENSRVLLKQRHFVGNRAVTPIEKLSTEDEKSSRGAEFLSPPSIYKEEVLENRSMKSNFEKSSKLEEGKKEGSRERGEEQQQEKEEKKEKKEKMVITPKCSVHAKKPQKPNLTSKCLEDFYPLSEADAEQLQIKSGREFSLNAMNEILLDMSKKLKDRWFYSKKGFLSYMSIAFRNEMRDAVKVSNNNFRIRSNQTLEEAIIQRQEEFLTQIEYSLQVSPEWHFRKKLCSVLRREKAYNLLSSYKYCSLKEDIFELHLAKHVELTDHDLDIILNQARASHESVDLATDTFIKIVDLKVIAPPVKAKPMPHELEQGAELPTGIWGNVRQALIGYFGKDGEALDKSWFSKLEPEIDEKKKTISLKAPSDFFRDWITQNYTQVLERCFTKEEYSYKIC